jgi:hypothetical protein
MPFQKGNKLGGRGGINIVTQQIISQLNELNKFKRVPNLDVIVEQLITQAAGYEVTVTKKVKGKEIKTKVEIPGDLAAIKEIIDRVQGKAPQSVTVGGEEDAPIVQIIRTIVQPPGRD